MDNSSNKYAALLDQVEQLLNEQMIEQAVKMAEQAVQRNRLNLRANYYLAEAYCYDQNWIESYRYYSILYNLQQAYKQTYLPDEEVLNKIDYVSEQAVRYMQLLPELEKEDYRKKLMDVNAPDKEIATNYFVRNEEIDDFFDAHHLFGKDYYLGRYNDWSGSYKRVDQNQNGIKSKAELFEVQSIGQEFKVECTPCIVPVVINRNSVIHEIEIENLKTHQKYSFLDTIFRTYSYYRFDEPVCIRSKSNLDIVFGKPIPLKHDPKHKKLILNIFFDSFNWKFIKDASLEEYMPNTAAFFSDGVICDRHYSGSEFTYPSVASYWTGDRATHHKVLNQNVNFPIPDQIPLFSEIFQDQGYFTAKIGGNDSVSPNYGYIRGIDRFLYEKSEQDFQVNYAVDDVIEHIRGFQETDQFIWFELQDLHHVASYFAMPLSVQTSLPLECKVIDNLGGSTLYQSPSTHRRRVYAKMLKNMDERLGELYHYIKTHYSKDEVIVTLMADHGNGFNVDGNQPFMSWQRTNVPLMIYGGEYPTHKCNDIIETIDYGHIMCKLAGITDPRIEQNDGQLPHFFGGSQEKEYAFAQSQFPDRNYEAGIYSDKFKFYYKSKELVTNECMVDLRGGSTILVDQNDYIIENAELTEACMNIIKSNLGDYLIG